MSDLAITGIVHAGHKEHAVEVPFDPAARWGRKAQRFAPGRRGVEVRGRIRGVAFTSHIVSRSGKHWLLLPAEIEQAADVRVGSEISVSVDAAAA